MNHTDTQPIVEVKNLNCRYGAFHAVSDLSFSVKPGEIYALLGTNGAGKTTTLETVEGHRTASSGTVKLFGETAVKAKTRSRTGIMLQESGFAGDLTVKESVELFGSVSGRKDNVAQLLDAVQLSHRAKSRVTQLSGGEKRRLDFATAIYGSPELVFLDEPTNALDPESRDAMWGLVRELNNAGSTIVLTTHYLEEAERHAHRIGLMHNGAMALEGTIDELVRSYPARISFTSTREVAAALPNSERFTIEGNTFVLATQNLQQDLLQLLTWADNHRLHLENLRAQSSSLADVFRAVANGSAPAGNAPVAGSTAA